MKCPSCGADLENPGKFCEMCGAPLPNDLSVYQDAPQPQQQAQPQPEPEPVPEPQQQAQQPEPQPQAQQPEPPYVQQQPYMQPPKVSGAPFVLAIIALVTAILGLFPIALILAIIALVMNSGQKKRGEFSTKQTPTFVMGIISLILSIIMFIVTILLGGAIWIALVSDPSILNGSSSASRTPSVSSSAAPSSSTKPSSSSAPSSSTKPSSSASSKPSYSTTERPTLSDFQWLNSDSMAGMVPEGSTELMDLSSVAGGWKAYMFGSGMERFCNANIEGSGQNATMTFKWGTAYDGATGQSHEDNTPDTVYKGTFSYGMFDSHDMSGNLTMSMFWENKGHQYATGLFQWPSGEYDTVALVRP